MPGGGSPSLAPSFLSRSSVPETVVIGAGVIGLGIAWRLAQAGCTVTVYDQGEAGHGASWAAAGMLAAAVETEPGEEPLLPLASKASACGPISRASSKQPPASRSSIATRARWSSR